MVGNAAIDAAQNLKKVLIAAAARKLEAKPEEIECWASFIVPARRTRASPSTRW